MIISISACSKTIKTEDGEISFKDGKIQVKTDEGTTTITEEGMTVDDEDGNSVFETSGDGVDLPDGFPEDLIPIIGENKIIATSKQELDAGNEYWATVITKKELKDVVGFYKNVLKEAEDSSAMESSDISILAGTKEGVQISVTITTGGEDEYKTSVNIYIVEN